MWAASCGAFQRIATMLLRRPGGGGQPATLANMGHKNSTKYRKIYERIGTMDGKHEIPGRQGGNCKETLTKIDYWSSLHTNIFTTYRGLWCGIWIWPMSPATTSLSDGGWRSLGMTELEFGHWIYLQTVTLRQVMYASLRLLAQGSPTQLRNDPHLARAAWTNEFFWLLARFRWERWEKWINGGFRAYMFVRCLLWICVGVQCFIFAFDVFQVGFLGSFCC